MRSLIVATAILILASCGSSTETRPSSSCLQALDAAEVVIGKAQEALGAAGDAITSFIAGDGQGITDANATLDRLGVTIGDDASDYARLAEECRAND